LFYGLGLVNNTTYNLFVLNKNYKNSTIVFLILLLVAISCVTVYDTISNRNYAHQYNPGLTPFHPEYGILMASATDNRLFFRFFPNEFAFLIAEGDSVPKAHIRFFFRTTRSYQSIEIVDSLTAFFNFKGRPRPQFMGFVPLQFPEKGRYIIEVFLTDLNSGQSVSQVLDVDFNPEGNQNSFLFLSEHANPIFYNHFSANDTFRVRSEFFNPSGIRVSYYQSDTTLPVPPDIQKETYLEPMAIDTSWIIPHPDTCLFTFNKKGVYFFSDTMGIHGKTYLCANEFYPYLKTPEELLRPLGYLCTEKEMQSFWELGSPKLAVDSFWLAAANDVDKARELIRVYYHRVQLANYYFTDFKEGWLTDRGMIYIIFGAPGQVRKTDDGEFWNYGRDSKDGLEFYFYNEYHPLFGKTSYLERSDLNTRLWFNAITTWREGRVFSLNQ